jgi:anaphase-promoting complex subunit 4
VLGSDRKHYRVLDMDYWKGGMRVGDGEDEDEDEGEGDGDDGVEEGDTEMGGA